MLNIEEMEKADAMPMQPASVKKGDVLADGIGGETEDGVMNILNKIQG